MNNRRKLALTAILTTLCFGCASSYTPREPGRISIVGATGRPVLVKDGKTYGFTGFSSEPVDAVAGNPEAEEHARTYVHRSRIGVVLYSLAVASLVGAIATHSNEPGHTVRNEVADGTLIGSLGLLIGSLVFISTAPGHLYDAINIYNDDVSRRQGR
jgi:hypothetical protein